MKLTLVLVLLASSLVGCAELPMKRCDAKFTQSDVMSCKEGLQGAYRRCAPPEDLYQGCVSPQ